MTTQHESYKSTGLTFLAFATCGASALTTYQRLISSAAASHVKASAMLESAPDLTIPVLASGLNLHESFANYDPVTCSWKTSQHSFIEGLDEFSATWPRSGTMQSGSVFRRRPLVPRISGTVYSYWPTPTVPNGGRSPKGISPTGMTADGKKRQVDLQHAVRMVERQMWPTPTAMNNTGGAALCKWGGSGARKRLRQLVSDQELNGALNPAWVEWLMGFPIGWTDLEDLG